MNKLVEKGEIKYRSVSTVVGSGKKANYASAK